MEKKKLNYQINKHFNNHLNQFYLKQSHIYYKQEKMLKNKFLNFKTVKIQMKIKYRL